MWPAVPCIGVHVCERLLCTGHACACGQVPPVPRPLYMAAAIGVLGQVGCRGWGPSEMMCCWGAGGRGGARARLGEPRPPKPIGARFASPQPIWELGLQANQWLLRNPAERRGQLGQAASAYKWPWSGAPSQSHWSPAGAAPSPWTPVTQAFVCPSSSRRVASPGRMPECWDGVSEGCGGGEAVGEEEVSLCLCPAADLPSAASPMGS